MKRKKIYFLFIFLCMAVSTSYAGTYNIAVGATQNIYCTANAPAGWITHVFYNLADPADGEYVQIVENHPTEQYAVFKGLKAKSNIRVIVTYCYTYYGSYDNNKHPGSAQYSDYINVTGSGSGNTSYDITFYSQELLASSNALQLIIGEENILYPRIDGSSITPKTNDTYNAGSLIGFGDPPAFTILMGGSNAYMISITPKREGWIYLVCNVNDHVGLCYIEANSYIVTENSIKYRCYTTGYAVVYGRDNAQGAINIPDSLQYNGKTYIVTEIGKYAFNNATGITSITIPETVHTIHEHAFDGCTGLASITIPDNVSLIKDYAFNNCSSLTSVSLPNNITTIPKYAFYGCSSLRSVTIPSNVTGIGQYAFYGCKALASINIPNVVKNIGERAFYSCTSLVSLSIPNSVTSIGSYAFNLVPNVVYSGSASGSPWAARSINGYVNGMLVYNNSSKISVLACSSSATSVSIPSTVTNIGSYAFVNCTNVPSITIPNTVASIGTNAFSGVRNIVYAGSATGSPWGAMNVGGYVDGSYVYENSSKTKLVACATSATGSISIPNTVTSIGNSAFSNCDKITSLIIPNTVTSVGNYAFTDCAHLKKVSIGDGVATIPDYAFVGCIELSDVSVGNGVTYVGLYAFKYCMLDKFVIYAETPPAVNDPAFYTPASNYNWRTLYVPAQSVAAYKQKLVWYKYFGNIDSIKVNNSIASGTCGTNLTWELTSDSVLTITGTGAMTNYSSSSNVPWYSYRQQIKEIVLPNGITNIGNYAFSGCNKISSVTIPNSVTSIGSSAFSTCSGIKTINISNLAAWCAISFGNSSANPLYYAKKLYLNGTLIKDLVFPNNVTSIKSYAFYNCSSITSIAIHNAVTSIGKDAFYGCSSMTKVQISNLSSWCNIDFENYASNPLSVAKHLYIGNAEITQLTIPNGVTALKPYVFDNGAYITSLTIPNSVTVIGASAFYGCSSLSSITNYTTTPQAIVSSVFTNVSTTQCPLYVPYESISAYQTADVWKTFSIIQPIQGTEPITSGTCGDNLTWDYNTGTKVLTISGYGAMYDYEDIYDDSGNWQTCSTPWYAYASSITYVSLPSGLTHIGKNAFSDFTSLTAITIPSSVTSIGITAFYACISLTTITIPSNVTSIGSGAFNYTAITSVVWNAKNCPPKIDDENNIYPPFYSIRENITSFVFGTAVEVVPQYLCYGMTQLNAIAIPSSVTSIGKDAFYGCSSMTKVQISNLSSWCNIDFETYSANPLSMAKHLYLGNEEITQLTIPNSVTAIKPYAFDNGAYITSVIIPNSVIAIGASAFYGCSSLSSITNYATTPQNITSSVFTNVSTTQCSLYVPAESLEAYQTADVWETFYNIQSIEGTDPTGIDEEPMHDGGQQATRKILRNGQLIIERDGKTYNVTGAEVK